MTNEYKPPYSVQKNTYGDGSVGYIVINANGGYEDGPFATAVMAEVIAAAMNDAADDLWAEV